MPVLPLVLSRMMRSGVSSPLASPSRIMRSAARSFTEPPALRNSALPNTATPGSSFSNMRMRNSGVLPMPPRIDVPRVSGATRSAAAPRVVSGMAPLSAATPSRPSRDLLGGAGRPETEPCGAPSRVLDDRDDTCGTQVNRAVFAGQLDEVRAANSHLDGCDRLRDGQLHGEVGPVG